MDELLRRVVVHGDFLEHYLTFRVEILERRLEHHVGHDVERRLRVRIGDTCIHHRVLPGSRGIQLAAEPVEDLGDLLRRVAPRPLEQHVLDEVRRPRLRVGLVP